jgi:shikimate kinase
MSKPIFLIGLMGAGKTTLAQYIAQQDNQIINFVDTDEVISSNHQSSISDIFKSKGERYFRNCEHELILNSAFENAVVATGGGLPCYNATIELLLQKGWVIYLKVAPTILAERLWNEKDSRPLLHDCETKQQLIEKLERLTREREMYYEKAHLIITNEEDLSEIYQKIKDLIN